MYVFYKKQTWTFWRKKDMLVLQKSLFKNIQEESPSVKTIIQVDTHLPESIQRPSSREAEECRYHRNANAYDNDHFGILLTLDVVLLSDRPR